MQDVEHIAMARLALPDNGLPGAQSCPLISNHVVGIESLITGVQQMDSPGVGVAVILCGEQIAVGRVGIDTGQDGLIALEDFVRQSNTNAGKVLGSVDLTGAPGSQLMQVVYTARADGHAQNVQEINQQPRQLRDQLGVERGFIAQLVDQHFRPQLVNHPLLKERFGCAPEVQIRIQLPTQAFDVEQCLLQQHQLRLNFNMKAP